MELPILHALRQKDKFRLLQHAVPQEMIGQEAKFVIGWMRQYWDAYPSHEFVDIDALDAMIRLKSGYDANQFALVKLILDRLRKPVDPETVRGVVGLLAELDYRGKAAAVIARHEAGEDVNIVYELARLTEQAKKATGQSAAELYIDEDVVSILKSEAGDHGIKLPTLLLSEHIKGMLGGASVALAGRPDKGKSSLTAFIAAKVAPQIPKYFDDDRPLLWLNNEGMGRRLIPRIYQAALNVTVDELYALSNEGKLEDAYLRAMGGRKDRIRVKDMHGADLARIEQVIEKMRPAVVITDMLANYKMPGSTGNIVQDTEHKWQEMREMACRLDFIHFGTIQISNDGDDQLYPAYSHLKDSKTGVQGATDVIVMMGALNDPGSFAVRGLSTPKNKFSMPGKRSHAQGQVHFDAPRCQFTDSPTEAKEYPT